MTSSRKGIIRGEIIDGVTFCSPTGRVETGEVADRREKESLKALEEFWYTKGKKEGQDSGFESGFEEGRSSGYSRGKDDGLRLGKEEGEKLGYDRGLAEGRDESADSVRQAIALLDEAAELFRNERKRLFQNVKPDLIRFALTGCEHILRQKLKEPDVFVKLLDSMIDQALPVFRDSPVTIFLHPNTKQILDERLETVGSKYQIAHLRWQADTTMTEGNCRIESEEGMLHFHLERQLSELEQKVLEAAETPEANDDSPEDEEGATEEIDDELESAIREPDFDLESTSSHPSLIPKGLPDENSKPEQSA